MSNESSWPNFKSHTSLRLTRDRLEKLETLVLNQAFIIEQLSLAVDDLLRPATREKIQLNSAEDLLTLMYEEDVPLTALRLAIEWRQRMAKPSIMQFSG